MIWMSIIRLGSCILCIHFNLRGGTCASMCANVPSTYTMTTACPSYLPTYLPTHLLVHIHSPNLSRFCNALLSLNASKTMRVQYHSIPSVVVRTKRARTLKAAHILITFPIPRLIRISSNFFTFFEVMSFCFYLRFKSNLSKYIKLDFYR